MSLFEENNKFAPLAENDNGVKIDDIEAVFKSYSNNVALLIKEYHDYFEWEASSTIAGEPVYVDNTNIMMKYFWNYIENRLKKHSSTIDKNFASYYNSIDFVHLVENELNAIRQYAGMIDVYQGIANEWENYDDNFLDGFLKKVDLFDEKFCDFVIKTDIVEELTDAIKEKQEYCETLKEVKERVKSEAVDEKEYNNNLYHDEEYQLIKNMIDSIQNYIHSLVHILYVDEHIRCAPSNPAFDDIYPDRLFYSTKLSKDELLKYIVKPSHGLEDAYRFLKKIYDYMWEYIPEEYKMKNLSYAVLDVAKYDYHKNIMTLESISATSDRKATTLLICKDFIKDFKKILDYVKFEYGHQYKQDEDYYDYVDDVMRDLDHRFNDAYDRRMLLVFPDLVEKYNHAKEELSLSFRSQEERCGEHHQNYDKLMAEIKEFIEKESERELEGRVLSSLSR